MTSDARMPKIEAIDREPWVRLANGAELANWGPEDEIAYNQANRQTQKLAFYVQAFDYLTNSNIRGDYHEYGCHRGRTFRMALSEARRHNLHAMKFFAFDSFEGLPDAESETDMPVWEKGALRTSETEFTRLVKEHGIYAGNCETIKGFYSDSLTEHLQLRFASDHSKIAMVCIDCDLYESATTVFDFIEPLLQEGSLLYIDDMIAGYKGSPTKGVSRAFQEFQRRSSWKFDPHMQVGWFGRSFITYLEE